MEAWFPPCFRGGAVWPVLGPPSAVFPITLRPMAGSAVLSSARVTPIDALMWQELVAFGNWVPLRSRRA